MEGEKEIFVEHRKELMAKNQTSDDTSINCSPLWYFQWKVYKH